MNKTDLIARSLIFTDTVRSAHGSSQSLEEYTEICADVAAQTGCDVGSMLIMMEWGRIGFPSIQMDHSLAADLMLTQPPKPLDIRCPWSAFLIEVPNNLVKLGRHEVSHVMVAERGDLVSREVFFAHSDIGVLQHTPLGEQSDGFLDGDTETMVSLDETNRAFAVLDVLVANVCAAATTPGGSGPGGTLTRRTSKASANREKRQFPAGQQYILGRPAVLRVDERTPEERKKLISAVREYVSTGRRDVGGAYWRRGHWHNSLAQGVSRTRGDDGRWHYGPERQRVFRPPTLVNKGEPLLVRPHVLKDGSDSTAANHQ